MNDVIYREDAIGAILSVGHIAELSDGDAVIRVSAVNYVLRNLPSAQPEQKSDIEEAVEYIKNAQEYLRDIGETWCANYLSDVIELLGKGEA